MKSPERKNLRLREPSVRDLRVLVRDVRLSARVIERVSEFELNRKAGPLRWFDELVLCILTANSSFTSAYKALNAIRPYYLNGSAEEISLLLRSSGYRFPNLKAKYIVQARDKFPQVIDYVISLAERDQYSARDVLVDNMVGLGMKEASHFLRNIGYLKLAIIDRHVLNFLVSLGCCGGRIGKAITRQLYLRLEGIILSVSSKVMVDPGVLDLYIWYAETGTILK